MAKLREEAIEHGVTVGRGFTSFERRFVYLYEDHFGYFARLPGVRLFLRTLLPSGIEERKRVLFKEGAKGLISYTYQQSMNEDAAKQWLQTPFVWQRDDKSFAVAQIWTVNYNKVFTDVFSIWDVASDNIPQDAKNAIREHMKYVVGAKTTPNGELAKDISDEDIDKELAKFLNGLAEFERALKELLGNIKGQIKYCVKWTRNTKPVYQGKGEQLLDWLKKSESAQQMLGATLSTEKNDTLVMQTRGGESKGPKTLEFTLSREVEYVMYSREGFTSFTTIKPKEQFQAEGNLIQCREWKGEGLKQIKEIGEGCFGTVFLKVDADGSEYACKKLDVDRDTPEWQVQRENDVISQLMDYPHPCIVTIYYPYFAYTMPRTVEILMEYCPKTLGDFINDGQQETYQPPAQALTWTGQIFLGMEHLHRRMPEHLGPPSKENPDGNVVLHRDINPKNVLIDSHGVVKLADFGHSRLGTSHGTGTWPVFGSFGYIAPEVFEATLNRTVLRADASQDLYSFGATTWHLFTGKKPPTEKKQNLGERAQDQTHLLQQMTSWSAAHPSADSVVDFARMLTNRDPSRRPLHDRIREFSFWKEEDQSWSKLSQKLPPFGHDVASDEAWVEQSIRRA